MADFEGDLQPGLGADLLRMHGYGNPAPGLGATLLQRRPQQVRHR